MAHTGNAFPLLDGDRGEESTGAAEKQAIQLSALYLSQKMAAKHDSTTAAATAATVDILFFAIEDHNTAVLVVLAQGNALGIH